MSNHTETIREIRTQRDRLIATLQSWGYRAAVGEGNPTTAANKIVIEHRRPEKPATDGSGIRVLDTDIVAWDEAHLAERVRAAGGTGVILATNHGTPTSIVHTFTFTGITDQVEPDGEQSNQARVRGGYMDDTYPQLDGTEQPAPRRPQTYIDSQGNDLGINDQVEEQPQIGESGCAERLGIITGLGNDPLGCLADVRWADGTTETRYLDAFKKVDKRAEVAAELRNLAGWLARHADAIDDGREMDTTLEDLGRDANELIQLHNRARADYNRHTKVRPQRHTAWA